MYFSMDGQLVLIRSVLNSILITKYQRVYCRRELGGNCIGSLVASFGGSEDKSKLHLVNWDAITLVISQRGLGIMTLDSRRYE